MYGYPMRGRGYRGQRYQHTGNFRGNFGFFQHEPPPEICYYEDFPSRGNFFFDSGVELKRGKSSKRRHKALKRAMMTAKEESNSEGGNAEDLVRTTMSDGDSEDEKEEKTEHLPSSSKSLEENQEWSLVRRNQLSCRICAFNTTYSGVMKSHLQSKFHQQLFQYLQEKLSKEKVDFLQESILERNLSAEKRRGLIDDTRIQHLSQRHDVTQELDRATFLKKIEAAKCIACNVFIPMHALNDHLKSPLHHSKGRIMMEKFERAALHKAENMLKQDHINQKVELYRKGHKPCIEDEEENSRSVCSTKAQESGQVTCSSHLASKVSTVPKSQMEVKREEDTPGGQGLRGEDAEDYACEVF